MYIILVDTTKYWYVWHDSDLKYIQFKWFQEYLIQDGDIQDQFP
jgi:hypothetical protein